MKLNVGKTDRIIRLIVGLALLSLVFIGPQTLWGLIGLVLIATSSVGFCPIYRALGMNTCTTTKPH